MRPDSWWPDWQEWPTDSESSVVQQEICWVPVFASRWFSSVVVFAWAGSRTILLRFRIRWWTYQTFTTLLLLLHSCVTMYAMGFVFELCRFAAKTGTLKTFLLYFVVCTESNWKYWHEILFREESMTEDALFDLLQDMLTLQSEVFTCVSEETCHKVLL